VVLGDAPTTMIRLPLSWADGLWEFRHPLDYLGTDGGGGIGSGPGMSVGAALALRDSGSDRLPVAVLGDGDFLMGVTALVPAMREAVAAVRAGKVCVVDVRVAPGYSAGATAAILQRTSG